jgi:hypothetical protein
MYALRQWLDMVFREVAKMFCFTWRWNQVNFRSTNYMLFHACRMSSVNVFAALNQLFQPFKLNNFTPQTGY